MADKLVKGVGALIGLATEAHAARKTNKVAKAISDDDSTQQAPLRESDDFLPSSVPSQISTSSRTSEAARYDKYDEEQVDQKYDSSHVETDEQPPPPYSGIEAEENAGESDEANWQLDDAVDEEERENESDEHPIEPSNSAKPGSIPSSKEGRQHYVDNIVHAFLAKYSTLQPPGSTDATGQLPCPVIIPQRRPHDKKRGFVRAYAPVLQPCGIDQEAFLAFLKAMHQSSKAAPVFRVINIAALIAGVVPSITAMIVSAVVQAVALTAIEVQGNMRTNDFLTQMNLAFFRPRGLFCLIFKYKPEDTATNETVDISSTILRTISASSSRFKQTITKASRASAHTKGEMAMPEVAPLIFPALDDIYARSATPQTKKESMKRKGKFVANYFDKRAQAAYKVENPDSVLANSNIQEHKFASRFADPNHPVNSGHPIALLTGGLINPKAAQEKLQRQGGLGGLLDARITRDGYRGLGGGGPLGLVSGLATMVMASRKGESSSDSNANASAPYGLSVPPPIDNVARRDEKYDGTPVQPNVNSYKCSQNQAGRKQGPGGMIKKMLKPVSIHSFSEGLVLG